MFKFEKPKKKYSRVEKVSDEVEVAEHNREDFQEEPVRLDENVVEGAMVETAEEREEEIGEILDDINEKYEEPLQNDEAYESRPQPPVGTGSFSYRERVEEEIDRLLKPHLAEEQKYYEHEEKKRHHPKDWPSVYTYWNGRYMEHYGSGYTPPGLSPYLGHTLGFGLGRMRVGLKKLQIKASEAYHAYRLKKLRHPHEIEDEGRGEIVKLLENQEGAITIQDIETRLGDYEKKLEWMYENSRYSDRWSIDQLKERIRNVRRYTQT